MPALPPEIVALEVKFLCTSCESRLGVDARWEGRGVICPVCGDKTRVPCWSEISQWPRTAEGSPKANPAGAAEVTLSSEEIAFLSHPASANPAVGA